MAKKGSKAHKKAIQEARRKRSEQKAEALAAWRNQHTNIVWFGSAFARQRPSPNDTGATLVEQDSPYAESRMPVPPEWLPTFARGEPEDLSNLPRLRLPEGPALARIRAKKAARDAAEAQAAAEAVARVAAQPEPEATQDEDPGCPANSEALVELAAALEEQIEETEVVLQRHPWISQIADSNRRIEVMKPMRRMERVFDFFLFPSHRGICDEIYGDTSESVHRLVKSGLGVRVIYARMLWAVVLVIYNVVLEYRRGFVHGEKKRSSGGD